MTKNSDPDMSEIEEQELALRARRPKGKDHVCRNCAFWEYRQYERKRLEAEADKLFTDVSAECHRHAPTPIAHIVVATGQHAAITAWASNAIANIKQDETQDYELGGQDIFEIHEWPRTNANAWCGEFVQLESKRSPP